MITVEELALVVEWVEVNKDLIKEVVIAAGASCPNSDSFDLEHLYGNLPAIIRVDISYCDPGTIKLYSQYDIVAPFKMMTTIIELYRKSL